MVHPPDLVSCLLRNQEYIAENPLYRNTFPQHTFQECSKRKVRQPGRRAQARMIVSRFKPTGFVDSCLIQININCYALECAANVFDEMPDRNCLTWTMMMFGYSVNGKTGLVQSLFYLMPEINLISWKYLLSGYLQNGNCLKSVQVFLMMGRDAVASNELCFSLDLKACASLKDYVIGLQVHGVIVE